MLSQDKIKESLLSLGYKLSDRGAYWQTNAVFRNGDNKTAIQIYKNTGVWKDHVQNSAFSPFKRLIEVTLGTNDPKQIKQYIDEEDIGANYNKLTFSEKLEMEEIYPEDCLKKLLPHYKFYNDKEIFKVFGTLKFSIVLVLKNKTKISDQGGPDLIDLLVLCVGVGGRRGPGSGPGAWGPDLGLGPRPRARAPSLGPGWPRAREKRGGL